MARRALVLGAGGPAAEAWAIGIITGLADQGLDVRDADLFVGTSAGSAVAIQLTSELTTRQLFARQIESPDQAKAAAAPIDFKGLKDDIARAKEAGGSPAQMLQRIGALALAKPGGDEADHREAIAVRLPVAGWPATRARVLAVAVDVESGERRAFERSSGIDVIDAVRASGAVPGIWPPVRFEGRRYMDGGTYSTANADFATGYERVLILELRPRVPPMAAVPPEAGVMILQRSGSLVDHIFPDEASEAAFASVGGNLLDPAVREKAAHAGRAQGRNIAVARVAPLWSVLTHA